MLKTEKIFQKVLTEGDTEVENIVGNIEDYFEDVEDRENVTEGTY